MSKVLVLYYSSYGHIESMANAVATGARRVAGIDLLVSDLFYNSSFKIKVGTKK